MTYNNARFILCILEREQLKQLYLYLHIEDIEEAIWKMQ